MKVLNADKKSVLKRQVQNNTPAKIKKTIEREDWRSNNIDIIKSNFPDAESVLCLGARHESEVLSFINAGFKAKGIDYCNGSEHVIKGDAAELEQYFAENEYDVLYASFSLEHICDIEKCFLGVKKVIKKGLFIVLPPVKNISVGHPTCFTVMKQQPESLDDLTEGQLLDFEVFKPFKVKYYSRDNFCIILCIVFTNNKEENQ